MPGPAPGAAGDIARALFDALNAHDVQAVLRLWAPGGVERTSSYGELRAPEGVEAFFTELLAAFPDLRYELLDLIASEDRAAARVRITGTFAGRRFQGFQPTGRAFELEALEIVCVRGGLIERIDQAMDGLELARRLGLMPARESPQERLMRAAVNARTRIARTLRPGGRRKRG